MGRLFLESAGGHRVFECGGCGASLASRSWLLSTRFTGATGRAFLFSRVLNVRRGPAQQRAMLSGRHTVRDVYCKRCRRRLGWFYEQALAPGQRYKEGRTALERALLVEVDGFDEPAP